MRKQTMSDVEQRPLDRAQIESYAERYGWLDPTVAPPPTESAFERERFEIQERIDAARERGDWDTVITASREMSAHQACVVQLHQLAGHHD
mgnify:FL=1|jgi:hypothetical protein